MKLEGQVALVTGGGSGIGAEIARALVDDGASIVLCGRRTAALEAVAKSLPGSHLCVTCDVREEEQVVSVVDTTIAKMGRLDILLNNAGIFEQAPIEETGANLWDDVVATNLRGPYLFSHHAWPHLKSSKGQILNLSSVAGTQGFRDSSAYCASKFGLNGLAEVLALEGKEHGIRVFSVCPASIKTDMWLKGADQATRDRMMKPQQVAEVVRWLLTSPRNLDIDPVVVKNFRSPFELNAS